MKKDKTEAEETPQDTPQTLQYEVERASTGEDIAIPPETESRARAHAKKIAELGGK